jgi:hypothetical protein
VGLTNADRAVVEIGKLRDYCLNPDHPRGRHKARVFAATLGLGTTDAERLRDTLLRAAVEGDVTPGEVDRYGRRYMVDFEMVTAVGQAILRSAWIVRDGEDVPRLTSCYVR